MYAFQARKKTLTYTQTYVHAFPARKYMHTHAHAWSYTQSGSGCTQGHVGCGYHDASLLLGEPCTVSFCYFAPVFKDIWVRISIFHICRCVCVCVYLFSCKHVTHIWYKPIKIPHMYGVELSYSIWWLHRKWPQHSMHELFVTFSCNNQFSRHIARTLVCTNRLASTWYCRDLTNIKELCVIYIWTDPAYHTSFRITLQYLGTQEGLGVGVSYGGDNGKRQVGLADAMCDCALLLESCV